MYQIASFHFLLQMRLNGRNERNNFYWGWRAVYKDLQLERWIVVSQ